MKLASFLSLSACERLERLRRLMRTFAKNANVINAPFWIFVYGSSSYGYNPKNKQGKFDDLDLFLIIPRSMSPSELLEIASKVFLTKLEAPLSHLQSILNGEYEICRMYGQVDGIKLGFRVMCQDVFEAACSTTGSTNAVRNICLLGQTHVIKEMEWNFKIRKYVPLIYPHSYVQIDGRDAVMIEHYCFSKKKNRLGTLGRKFLAATVIYECDKRIVTSRIQNLWKIFALNARRYRPGLTPFQLVSSIYRSDRFSPEFTERLCKMVS